MEKIPYNSVKATIQELVLSQKTIEIDLVYLLHYLYLEFKPKHKKAFQDFWLEKMLEKGWVRRDYNTRSYSSSPYIFSALFKYKLK